MELDDEWIIEKEDACLPEDISWMNVHECFKEDGVSGNKRKRDNDDDEDDNDEEGDDIRPHETLLVEEDEDDIRVSEALPQLIPASINPSASAHFSNERDELTMEHNNSTNIQQQNEMHYADTAIGMHCANFVQVFARFTKATKISSTQKPQLQINVYKKRIKFDIVKDILIMRSTGNEADIDIWSDCWLEDGRLKDRFPLLGTMERVKKVKLHKIIVLAGEDGWPWTLDRSLRSTASREFEDARLLLPISPHPRDTDMGWGLGDKWNFT
ncbi:hypothetical protein OSB04_019350, partial [Centaurea solstitialis]